MTIERSPFFKDPLMPWESKEIIRSEEPTFPKRLRADPFVDRDLESRSPFPTAPPKITRVTVTYSNGRTEQYDPSEVRGTEYEGIFLAPRKMPLPRLAPLTTASKEKHDWRLPSKPCSFNPDRTFPYRLYK